MRQPADYLWYECAVNNFIAGPKIARANELSCLHETESLSHVSESRSQVGNRMATSRH